MSERLVSGYLDLTLPTLPENLALDEALLIEADERDGPGILRVWQWPQYAVVLGASGRVGDDVRNAACEADGVPLARRSSGGGTVVLGPGAWNFTVILPIEAARELAAVDTAQAYVLGRVADALRQEGVSAEVRGSGDVTVADRKISGSAQRRMKRAILVHATVLCRFELARIPRYLSEPRRRPDYRGDRPHDRFVANLGWEPERLATVVRRAWLGEARSAEVLVPEGLVAELTRTKFADPAWVSRL